MRDPELCFRANPLRSNLYERVLLAKLLATPEAHPGLRAASLPEEPGGEEHRALQAALEGTPLTTLARLVQHRVRRTRLAAGAVLAVQAGRA